jgi:hypothetical protein
MAAFNPPSKSTNVPSFQSCSRNWSLVTSSPGCSSSKSRIRKGYLENRTRMPLFRSSLVFDRLWKACAISPPEQSSGFMSIRRTAWRAATPIRSFSWTSGDASAIEVVFLNKAIGSPEDDHLLLQVQGVVAEYERAKIMERCRRGKRHAARTGNVGVMSCAPYGYRYISSQEGGGVARFEPIPAQARVVRRIFTWVGRDRLSLYQVAQRHLEHARVRSAVPASQA